MKYTFEISICGCDTICKHCYVGGGPSSIMNFEIYQRIVEKLKPVISRLGDDIAITLGNEPFKHPQITEIVSYSRKNIASYYPGQSFDMPTTGISLLQREDKDKVLNIFREMGCKSAMLTLHGNEKHHNEIVCHPSGFSAIKNTADFLAENSFHVHYNLMLNKYLAEDWNYLMSFISKMKNVKVRLTIPLFVPTNRLRKFTKYRAELSDCEVLINKTFGFGIDKHKFIEKIYNFNEKSILNRIDDQWDFCEKDSQQPQWAFFHISINGELYYGNAGLHTKHLGNVLEMSYDEIYDKIADKSANYDYSAYYEIKRLPSVDEILNYAKSSNSNYIFSDIESCIYYWLDKMNVRSILL